MCNREFPPEDRESAELVELRQRIAELEAVDTERKLAEEALRESEERLRSLFETMDEGVILIAPDGQIVQANLAAERILGLKRSEIEGRSYVSPEWEILRPDGTSMPPEEMAGPRAMREKRPVTDTVMGTKRPDGSISWINVSAAPLIDEAGKLGGVVGTFADITERKRAEEALTELLEKIEQAKQEWESTADSLPELICLVDDRGRIMRANRTVETWNLGRVADVKGQEFHELLHPDCADSSCYLNSFWKRAWEEAIRGQPAQYEAYDEILKRHVLLRLRPSKDWEERAAIGSTVVIVQDITERVVATQMRDDLTDMMVHDLRNPLSNIASSLGLMRDAIVGGDETLPMPQLLAVATRGCEQLFRLVDSVLDLRHLEAAEVELTKAPVNPRELVEEMAEQMQPSALSRKQSLEVQVAPGVPDVPADRGLIFRVLNNLLDNAIKFTPTEGHIELRIEQAGDSVLFAVSDDGPGIPPEQRDHIFDRFLRLETAADSKGSGLGLAFCKLAVAAHGGRIWVESRPGQGATFCFTLPVKATESVSDERGAKSNES